ncbi:hypothetical protein DVH05_004402 [Phytophthora capsici]|nr:hypothetical protein DVH05_004402 [Phytophthora capsici]
MLPRDYDKQLADLKKVESVAKALQGNEGCSSVAGWLHFRQTTLCSVHCPTR